MLRAVFAHRGPVNNSLIQILLNELTSIFDPEVIGCVSPVTTDTLLQLEFVQTARRETASLEHDVATHLVSNS